MTAVIPPLLDLPNVKESVVYPKVGLPVRVQMAYDINQQGIVCAMNVCYGAAVVRPDYGQYYVTT